MTLIFESPRILSDYQSRKLLNTSLILSQCFGISAVLCVVTWMGSYEDGGFSWRDNPEKQFHYHPTLMGIGPIFIFGEAILVYRIFRNETKRECIIFCFEKYPLDLNVPRCIRFIKLLHMSLHSLVFVFALVALKAVWDSHDYHRGPGGQLDPLPNLYSLHSWIGIFFFVSFCLQVYLASEQLYKYVGGFFTYLYPGAPMDTRRFLLPFHQLFGILLLIGFTVAVVVGISERAAWKHTCWTRDKQLCGEQVLANLFGVLVVAYTSTVIFIVMNPRWKRSQPEEENLQLIE